MASDKGFPEAMAAAMALQRVMPLTPWGVVWFQIGSILPPLIPWRARCEWTYLPKGKKRQRTVRWDGVGDSLAAALHALADDLEQRPARREA